MSLDNHTKELIAIGASVSANCMPCLEYHSAKAAEYGSDEIEIKEAVEVGKLVRRGASAKMDKYISTMVDNHNRVEQKEDSDCGCTK